MIKYKLKVLMAGNLIGASLAVVVFVLSTGGLNAKTKGITCDKHPIYCQIKKNSPKLNHKRAFHLSNVIFKAAKKHGIPVRIFVGILAQESMYKLSAQGCHKGLVDGKYAVVKVCSDFGIGQIYYRTAKGFGFDIALLTTDLEYSINASATVLADFKKRYSAKEVDYWTRYNASSPVKRRIYKKLVERYL